MTDTDYQSICKSNAERFLKTAFLLDDKVVFEVTAATETDTKITKLPLVPLKGTTLTKSFLEKGISCSILKPSEEEKGSKSLESYIIDVIRNVDLPILDWSIHGDDGEWVIAILRRLIEEYHYPEGRVALILIYTELNVEQVYDKVRESLRDIINGLESRSEDSYLLTIGGLRILFAQRDEAMDEEQLPEYLTGEFSKIHRGILENSVMQAISEIREKTYHLLSRFPAKLDAPFLAQRSVLENPEDSTLHVFELITSEIYSLLTQSDLPQNILPKDAIPATVRRLSDSVLAPIRTEGSTMELTEIRTSLINLLENGVKPDESPSLRYEQLSNNTKNTDLNLSKKKRKDLISQLTKLLSFNSGSEYDEEFSELCMFQHGYPAYSPQLTLGALVCRDDRSYGSQYYLCIMPYCDSERLKGVVTVPFLHLDIPDKDNSHFNVTVNHNNNRQRLRIDNSPSRLITYKFKILQKSDGKILADNGIFKTSGGSNLIWIGTLKREFALRLAGEFGSGIARVGLNESEWQRLHSRKKIHE